MKIELSDSEDENKYKKTDSSEDNSEELNDKTGELKENFLENIMGDSRGFDFFKLNGYTVCSF